MLGFFGSVSSVKFLLGKTKPKTEFEFLWVLHDL
jgi:hypothetical protein